MNGVGMGYGSEVKAYNGVTIDCILRWAPGEATG